jgi:hypothetical protein
MKNNITIKIKNELPELIEAVCLHKDCPEWLKDGIWDTFSEQNTALTFSATFWRAQLEGMEEAYEPELKTVDSVTNPLDAEILDGEVSK